MTTLQNIIGNPETVKAVRLSMADIGLLNVTYNDKAVGVKGWNSFNLRAVGDELGLNRAELVAEVMKVYGAAVKQSTFRI